MRLLVAAFRLARAEAVLVAALLITGLSIIAFAEIADDVAEADTQAFDRFVLEAVRTPGEPGNPIGPHWVEIAMADLTALGGIAVLVVIALVVSGFLLMRRRAIAVMFLATALGGGIVLSQFLKGAFGRERPPVDFRAVEAVNPSFPSGHAMLSAVVYLTIGSLVAKAMPQKRLKAYVMGVAIVLALVVGLSRVYLGVHWASDVTAGWCIGAAWATVCWLAAWGFERFNGRQGISRPQHLPPGRAADNPAPAAGE